MRSTAWALLLLGTACITQASGATASVDPVVRLQPPPELLPDAAVRFSIRLGVHDELISTSPELALFPQGLHLGDEHLRALRALAIEHQPAGASVFGAVAGPTAAHMREAETGLHASQDIFEQAFALDHALGRHIRLYLPARDSAALTQALRGWVQTAYASPVESLPNGPCEAAGASVCVQSLNRFVAVTDEDWGARIDIAELLWPSLDGERFLQFTSADEAGRRARREALRRLGHEDQLDPKRSKTSEYWARVYAAPGLASAPAPPAAVVSAAVDPHAVMRLAQTLEISSQYAYELGRALRQATPDAADDPRPSAYDVPALVPLSEGFPFANYVAQWHFERDARTIDLQWELNDVGRALLARTRPEVPIPDPASVCDDTSACAVISESFSGILNASKFDPLSLARPQREHLMWPVVFGAWPNVLSESRKGLPTDPMQADGALAAAAWRDGWGRLEFAVGSWSRDTTSRPVVPTETRLPVEGGERHYMPETNFVIVDAPVPDAEGWIAASDLVRAAWLSQRPTAPFTSGATVRVADLLAAQRVVFGPSRSSRWSELNVDLTLQGDIVGGRVVLAGNRQRAGQ